MTNIPYAEATSGHRARADITEMLQKAGCTQVGILDNFEAAELVLSFVHRGRPFLMRASTKGWAAWYLRQNRWNSRRKATEVDWRARAQRQGMIAVSSILRDWCKGQVTAIECGILSFEAAFGLHLVGSDGRTMVETSGFQQMLAPPKNDKS